MVAEAQKRTDGGRDVEWREHATSEPSDGGVCAVEDCPGPIAGVLLTHGADRLAHEAAFEVKGFLARP